MGTINVTLGDATQLNLPLGRQLENDVTEVVFDFSAWNTTYGAGTLSLSVQRKGDEMPYPVTMTVSGTNATWEVTDTDTARKGVGKAQLTYTVGDAVKKSVIYKFTVYESLGADGEYPAPGSTWMEDIEERVEALEAGSTGGLTDSAKTALLQIAEKVAYIDDQGQTYYDALHDALYPPATLSYITCVYTQSGTVYDTDTLDSLKTDLVVTAHYDNGTTATVTTYTLSGTLAEGTSTVTVTYGGKTTTFNVTVTEWQPITVTLTWTGSGTDKKTNLIDATEYDAYFTLPFVSGSPNLVAGATVESLGCKEYVEIFDDSAGTHRIGYYYTDTKQIESGRTTANSPFVPFETEEIFVPKGYYGKIVLSRVNTDVWSSNSNFLQYLDANATEAIMR